MWKFNTSGNHLENIVVKKKRLLTFDSHENYVHSNFCKKFYLDVRELNCLF